MLRRTDFLNPLTSNSSRYVPTGTSGSTKSPPLLVSAVRLAPVCSFTSVTFTPGITAPEGSFTCPRIRPFVCANVVAAVISRIDRKHARSADLRSSGFMGPPHMADHDCCRPLKIYGLLQEQ